MKAQQGLTYEYKAFEIFHACSTTFLYQTMGLHFYRLYFYWNSTNFKVNKYNILIAFFIHSH